jgi:nucleotide-binding universal stress UspA family protein
MIRRILVAIDGSDGAAKALDYSIEEAKKRNAELHIVYVIQTAGLYQNILMNTADPVGDPASYRTLQMLTEEGKNITSAAEERARDEGIEVYTHLPDGHPGDMIINKANETGSDMIVIGSHGKRGMIEEFLIGSVSMFVATHSPVTTMIVK